MLKKYLLNLYKNINLYSNLDESKYIEVNEKNINIMIGGNDPDHYQKVFLDLFGLIKQDLDKIKLNQPINTDEIAVKLRSFKVFTEIYQNYISQLMNEHIIAKEKIDNIYLIAKDENTIKVLNAVENISTEFKKLLDITDKNVDKPKFDQ